ncbi:hypothetical protein SHO565_63760 [Streptomyces sp. HO565]
MAGMSALVSARVIQVLPMTMEDPFQEMFVWLPASSRSQRGRQEGQATARDVRETRALRSVASSAVINLTSPVLSS